MTAHDLMKAHSAAYAAWSVALRRGDAIEPLTFPRVVVGQRRCPDGGLQDVYATSAGEIDEAFAPRINVARTKLRDPKVALSFYAQRDALKRELADLEAAVHCPSVQFNGNDALAHVISLNLRRRHLDDGQREMVAAKIATLRQGGNRQPNQTANWRDAPTASEAAEIAAHVLVFERLAVLPTGTLKRFLRSLARASERPADDHRHAA